ncbi:MAG: Cobyrinic acid a,c-diamide synthetase [uncultured Rubrobacteraceae bacterium]|uniref:Hydrogenobyrinate a,c-diamide synthase n=1 Tax=uncultured Rubrobacteraceae bacterium TaxID=349277 RepID=A0A6J4R0K0_9ACTN|nr:MAG: Cobyrinic acid a,c-diamide synthetase [uncultured Rubrobacteraceae bacterium]
MVSTPRVVVAGTHSGVGKTTVASGLVAALANRGLRVAPFKVGPDFIDPSYHALAAGRPGRNLDAYLSGPDLIPPLFAHGARGADVAVIEGVMGLFDGKGGGGELASTAHVAKLLDAPVVLVVDARAMARSAAAMVHGYATFDPGLRLAGVVLNRVGSATHEGMLREALAPLGTPVLGVLRRDDAVRTPDRHLGLVPAAERRAEARRSLGALGDVVAEGLDLDAVMRLAASTGSPDAPPWSPEAPEEDRTDGVRVAVATGPSFSFLYTENVELMEGAGAEVAYFDPTSDEALPAGTDALYLGGGFPEAYAEALSANGPMKEGVRRFAAEGRPVVAECGGLLYLARELDGNPMCGVLDAAARMTDRLKLGYREARAIPTSPLAEKGRSVRGHEFHYSAVEPGSGETPAWDLAGRGPEGFVAGGVHASYLHTHWAATPGLPRRFLRAARRTEVRV